jgi:Glycosyl hydrolase family 79 C-terminal beta domain
MVAISVTLVALAVVLVPLAVANIGDTLAPTTEPSQQPPSVFNSPVVPRRHRRTRRAAASTLPTATLTVAPNAGAVPVPGSFLGISTEYWALPLFERNTPVFERVLGMLHVAGDGPLILRIGGDSADHAFYSREWRRMPSWAYELTPGYLSRLKALVERDRVKLIVDLNLVTDSPVTAAAWARAAETSLPKGSIIGFEIGNEPDLYSRRHWVATVAASPFEARLFPLELTPETYVQDFAAYAHVLGENSPDIPLVGPAVAHPRVSLPFISALIADQRPELGMVTGHLYPYSACVKQPNRPDYPTVPRLLSGKATSAFDTDVTSAAATAHAAGLEFRLTEFNSVTCGGKPGVSDTFATALWAPDALFTAMRAGVDGANLHVRENAINAAFTINRRGLAPRPLLYGLLLFTRMLGPQSQLVRLQLRTPRSVELSAWAVKIEDKFLHVLLIDKSGRSVRVRLRLPTAAPASVQRLMAPSPYSRSGVTLNGQHLGSAGQWIGTPRTETITPAGRGGYYLTVPARSAALVSVRLGVPRRPIAGRRAVSKHHGRVAVPQHPVLAVGLNRPRQH